MIFPPRAEVLTDREHLQQYDNGAYLAQPKLNGACAILQLSGNGESKMWSRHNAILSNVKDLNFSELYNGNGGEMLLAGEYLNKNKVGQNGPFNHKFVIWDILKYNGKPLVGSTVMERVDMLNGLYASMSAWVNEAGQYVQEDYMYRISENIYWVTSYANGFVNLYDNLLKIDLMEGLVLKRLNAKLAPGFNQKNNTDWQIKIRKPTKNYYQ